MTYALAVYVLVSSAVLMALFFADAREHPVTTAVGVLQGVAVLALAGSVVI